GISINRLTQTIKDVITVTLALKINFLRADCICIIQDSTINMEYKITRIRNVYQNAYVTIIA
ncbi:hypothetical protein AOQ84DRAFT_277616, partial [Glonium stellatum]